MTFLIASLAAYRITRLITTDLIAEVPRAWLLDRWQGSRFAQGLVCSWCVGAWVCAAGATGAALLGYLSPLSAALWALGASTVVGLLGQIEPD